MYWKKCRFYRKIILSDKWVYTIFYVQCKCQALNILYISSTKTSTIKMPVFSDEITHIDVKQFGGHKDEVKLYTCNIQKISAVCTYV